MYLPRLVVLVVLVSLVAAARRADAQESGKAGITMGYPASIGLVYHLTDRVALRPELTFSRASSESESRLTLLTNDSSSLGIGVSGLVYLRRWERLRAYVSPRYIYSRSRSTSESSFGFEANTTTISSHTGAGAFGAQYSPHDRFSVFAEVGVGYTAQQNKGTLSGVRITTSTVGSRTGVGVVFYF